MIDDAFNKSVDYYDTWIRKALPCYDELFSVAVECTPLLQKSEAFSLRVNKGEAVVGYCDPLIARWLGASGFPEG